MTASSYVFDSWALPAFLEDKPAARSVEKLIDQTRDADTALMVTTVNLGEVWYSMARARSAADADLAVEQIGRLEFEFVPADWELSFNAALLKSKGKVAYADCFAAVLAKLRKAAVVTGDLEFKQFEGQVKIHWLK
jgi:predicted nucleic acid-binding protein